MCVCACVRACVRACVCVCEEDLGERICMQWHVLAIQLSWVHIVLLCMPMSSYGLCVSVLGVCVEGGVCMGVCKLGVGNITKTC